MKQLTMLETIKVALQESIVCEEPPDETNWDFETGVLLTQNEVKYLLSFVPDDES